MITQSELKDLLYYNPYTGNFVWKDTRGSRRYGSVAGHIDGSKYIGIQINGNPYKAHRLAWLYMKGKFPPNQIDHINHKRNDNRIINLREATHNINAKNKSKSSRNKSGVTGVRWESVRNKWRASIMIDGSQKYLGLFIDKKDAIKARKQAEVEYGFHTNHGRA